MAKNVYCFDHRTDHFHARTTRTQGTRKRQTKKLPRCMQSKSAKKACHYGLLRLWEQDVAGSNPVIPTKQNRGMACHSAILFLSKWRVQARCKNACVLAATPRSGFACRSQILSFRHERSPHTIWKHSSAG